MSIPLLWRAHSGLSKPVFGVAMGPFMNVDTSALVGPFGIIDAGIRRWLWAHSGISTLLPRWAHSGLSTPVFGDGYGPIQIYRHCCFGGPTQDYRSRYSVWLWAHSGMSTLLLRWARSGLSTLLLGGDCGPIHECRYLCFGGPIQDYRCWYSAVAMGPFRYIDIAASVGPLRIIDAGIRRWLWAHSGISTLLLRWAHSGLSTPVFGVGYGPIQVYRRCCLGGPIHDYRLHHSAAAVGPFENIDLCFGGPTQDYRSQYSVLAVGPFKNIGGILLHQRSAYSTMSPAYIHGPIRIYRRHRFALEVGRFETIGDTSVLVLNLFGPIRHFRHTNSTSLKAFQEGPTRDHRHKQNMGPSMLCDNIYMMGPYGLRRKYRHICTWILPTTSNNICYIM